MRPAPRWRKLSSTRLRQMGGEPRSAGTEPKAKVRDEAIAVMREVGIEISARRSKGMNEALGSDVALVARNI